MSGCTLNLVLSSLKQHPKRSCFVRDTRTDPLLIITRLSYVQSSADGCFPLLRCFYGIFTCCLITELTVICLSESLFYLLWICRGPTGGSEQRFLRWASVRWPVLPLGLPLHQTGGRGAGEPLPRSPGSISAVLGSNAVVLPER